MSLDLDDVTADWSTTPGEISARSVQGRDGTELLQLRVDLGVLQMFPDDRPDGMRYHGLPTTFEYVQHELCAGRKPAAEDWRELERELSQLNYRRLAFASLADAAMNRNDKDAARHHLLRSIRDIDACLKILRAAEKYRERPRNDGLRPTLTFNRARLLTQVRVVEGRFDEAIEDAEDGARALEKMLLDCGYEQEQAEQDAGVLFLIQLGERLRKQYSIELTLREQLNAAIENEDFEAAAQLREELHRRQQKSSPTLPPPEA